MINDNLLKAILDHLSDGVYFVNTDGVISYWNKGAERMTGFAASEVVGRRCSDNILVHVNRKGTSLCERMCPLAATIKDGKERVSQIYLRHKEGHRLPVYTSVVSIRDSAGKIAGGVECFHDNSQTLAALEEVGEQRKGALICKVTEVGNRLFIEQMMESKLVKPGINGGNMAVLCFEIDRYDEYSRSLGQNVMDIIAKIVAKTLATNLQSHDFIGRWSDKEFIVFLTNVGSENYVRVAKRLSALISMSSESILRDRLHITVSSGACPVEPTDTKESLINHVRKLAQNSMALGGNHLTVQA